MKRFVCVVALVLLTAPGWGATCNKGGKVCGDITPGRPKMWSIRDAHYLIGEARQKLGALGIKADLILDPNGVNSRSLEILKTSFGVSAKFDGATAAQNQQALRQSERDWGAYEENRRLVTRLDEEVLRYEDQVAVNTGRIKALKAKKSRLEAGIADIEERVAAEGATQPTIDALTSEKQQNQKQLGETDDEIAELEGENQALSTKIQGRTARRDELAKMQAPEPVTLTAVSPSAIGAGGSSSNGSAGFSDLVESAAVKDGLKKAIENVLTEDPKLHYSQQLDNLLDASMQLVSRRLALLKQSIDPNYELYFVELPTSINPNSRGKHHIAQARWNVEVVERNYERYLEDVGLLSPYDSERCELRDKARALYNALREGNKEKSKAAYESLSKTLATVYKVKTPPPAFDAEPYIYELSPAQSALNIARHSKRAKNFGLKGIVSLIGGLGVSTEYKKQREQYGQFMERPVFAAGQGKGMSVFGWDFAPMAGEAFLAPGTYTTFAVLSVPKIATRLQFRSSGVWARKPAKGRREVRELDFQNGEVFTVELPTYQRYWVSSIRYKAVPAGKPISVIVKGSGFSNETEVLVNNVPLERRMRLVDPGTREVGRPRPKPASEGKPVSDTAAGAVVGPLSTDDYAYVRGEFEVVSPTSMVLRFRCSADFVGIPQIIFVAASKSIRLNRLELRVNGKPGRLDKLQAAFEKGEQVNDAFFMPGSNWKRADVVAVVPDSRNGQADLTLALHGVNLDQRHGLTFWTRKLNRNAGFYGEAENASKAGSNGVAGLAGKYAANGAGPPGTKPEPSCVADSGWESAGDKVDVSPSNRRIFLNRVEVDAGSRLWLAVCRDKKVEFIQSFKIPFRPYLKGFRIGDGSKDKGTLGRLSGPAAGGRTVILVGKHLGDAGQVFFGSKPAVVESLDEDEIAVRVPSGKPGEVVLIKVLIAAAEPEQKPRTSLGIVEYAYNKN